MSKIDKDIGITREAGSIGRLLGLFTVLVVGFLILPVAFVIFYSFNKSEYFVFPPKALSLKWFLNFFTLEQFQHASLISLSLAAIVTPITTAMAIGVAYGLVRGRFRGASVLNSILLSPIIIPGVVTGMALMTFFSIAGMNWSYLNITISMILICLPFPVRTITANMYGLNPSIEEAAINLGANRWTTFLKIVLPQIRPGILGGMIFVFAMVLEDVSVVIFLTDINTSTLAITALEYVFNKDDPTIAAMATLLIILTVVLVFVIERFIGLDKFMALD